MEVCRLCNVSESRGLFYHIFDNPQTNPTIPTIVEMLTKLKIYEDDPYTKMVCFNCFNALITIHKYRERILETDRLLKIKTEDVEIFEDFHENLPWMDNEENSKFKVEFENSDADMEMNLLLGGDSGDEDYHCSNISTENNKEKLQVNNVVGSDEDEDEDENDRVDNNNQFPNILTDSESNEINFININNSVKKRNSVKPYKCNICNQRFTRKSTVNRHLIIHTGEKPYECNNCDKKFTQKSNLNRHLRTHTFTCKICNQTFPQKINLNVHLKVHPTEKPYKCKNCDQRFTEKSHLNVHLRLHTGEKPYRCNFCFKRFAVKSNFNRHVKVHKNNLKVHIFK